MAQRIVNSDPRSPRPIKECAVARFAINCLEDTDTPDFMIIACVAKALGLERVWVPDKAAAMKAAGDTFNKDIESLFLQASTDIANEIDQTLYGNYVGDDYWGRWKNIEKKYEELIVGKLEEAIAIEAVNFLDAFEAGVETYVNWVVYKLMTLISKYMGIGGFWGAWILQGTLNIIQWFAGMFVSFTEGMSLDVDDVIRGNPEYCKCLQPDNINNWRMDKNRGKRDDDERKKPKPKKRRKPVDYSRLPKKRGK